MTGQGVPPKESRVTCTVSEKQNRNGVVVNPTCRPLIVAGSDKITSKPLKDRLVLRNFLLNIFTEGVLTFKDRPHLHFSVTPKVDTLGLHWAHPLLASGFCSPHVQYGPFLLGPSGFHYRQRGWNWNRIDFFFLLSSLG